MLIQLLLLEDIPLFSTESNENKCPHAYEYVLISEENALQNLNRPA